MSFVQFLVWLQLTKQLQKLNGLDPTYLKAIKSV